MIILTILITAGLLANSAGFASAAECLTEAPKTVYEAEDLSPQNIDYDAENALFIAHPGWYNDAFIHYYKFRIFAPGTYEGLIASGSTAADVPVQKIYLVTTSGGFDGVLGKPIIEYHHVDGLLYSDFMGINFVMAPEGYIEDDFKSVKDITTSGATVTSAEILINLPVVPTGSNLQHPITKGTNRAPIDPVPVWYNCVEVWTYLFEVTDEAAANHFAYTRSPEDVTTTRAGESGYEIFVTPNLGSAANDQVNSIPLWFVNQYTRGVVEGTGGGPDPNGMRNVVNLDRPDPGYSPLWQLFWATELPIDYSANEASSITTMSAANGFVFFTTPMFVNCPNIGPVDKEALNDDKKDNFTTTVTISSNTTTNESVWILGSHESLIFQPEMPISFVSSPDGTTIATTQTNMAGAYELELTLSEVPVRTSEIKVMSGEDVIRTISVTSDGDDSDGEGSNVPSDEQSTSGAVVLTIYGSAVLAVSVMMALTVIM